MILRVLAGAAVIALLVVGWLTVNDQQSGPAPTETVRKVQNPGYSAQDALLIETGADGHAMYTLHASEVHQEPGSDAVRLVDVTLRFRDPSGRVWSGRANQGLVSRQAVNVDLSGAVRLSGLMPKRHEPVSISSDRLEIQTRKQTVKTQDPVALDWNGQRLTARGLVVDLKNERMELESDVHGLYRP